MRANYIHPTAIVEKGASIGTGNYIGPFCYITKDCIIGDNNRFEAYCSVGTPPENRDHFTDSPYPVIIGNNCTIREFTTINAGTIRNTSLGNGVVMLRGSHIGHDSIIEDRVNISCNVLIGGHSRLMEGVNMGLGSMCHQFSKIGAYSMIGMGAVVLKHTAVLPGGIYVGTPATLLKPNVIGLERGGIDDIKLLEFTKHYILL